MNTVSIRIDGKEIFAEPGKRLLDVAKENGIDIPSLCFHPDIETQHHCNMCLVEVSGEIDFKRACSTVVRQGMEVLTNSEQIAEARKNNLDTILNKHLLECNDCVWFQHCKLLALVRKFEAKPKMIKNEADTVFEVGSMVFDQSKCIGCENCTAVCPVGFLDLNDRSRVTPSADATRDCISCGQCIVHCPVGALEGVGEFEELEKHFLNTEKTTIVQFAPSIRASIGDEFGLESGQILTGQLIAGLKKLGFDYVFDTAAGADFTTMEESDELIDRLTKREKLPAFTSCCPAWVQYVEFAHPEFVPNLCTSRSPQVMLGGIVKKYWSKKHKIDPKDIFVVSIMPCVAKKHEIKREELKIDGMYPVDMVLTTRELVRLLKKNGIVLGKLPEEKIDDPLGSPSGAGVIYGASGGVFESALRTAYFKMTGKELADDAVKDIRGQKGIKIKEVQLGERTVRLAVVSGIKNAQVLMKEIQTHPKLFDAVEVMACPGGCVGGGGQSLPMTMEIAKKRAHALYAIDAQSKIRRAHENPLITKTYKEFFTTPAIRHEVLHTEFSQKEKSEIKAIANSKETI